MCIQQVGSMFTPFFGVDSVTNMIEARQNNEAMYRRFFKFALERGIFGPPSPYEAWFISSVHTKEHLLLFQEAVMEFIEQESR